MLMGDYVAQVDEINMESFGKIYELRNLINEPTCYKNPLNPLYIDLLLTENVNSFQKTFVCDFHKLIDAMKKSRIPKEKPNIKCRKCKILLKKKV